MRFEYEGMRFERDLNYRGAFWARLEFRGVRFGRDVCLEMCVFELKGCVLARFELKECVLGEI